jgi:hypothetical protein
MSNSFKYSEFHWWEIISRDTYWVKEQLLINEKFFRQEFNCEFLS